MQFIIIGGYVFFTTEALRSLRRTEKIVIIRKIRSNPHNLVILSALSALVVFFQSNLFTNQALRSLRRTEKMVIIRKIRSNPYKLVSLSALSALVVFLFRLTYLQIRR